MTVLQLIKASYRLLVGEDDPSTEVIDHGLGVLNSILNEWSTQRWGTYVTQQETHTLTAATASYTIGSGGAISTTRPVDVIGAFVRSGSTDYPLRKLSVDDYRALPEKATAGIPNRYYYAQSYPLGVIYLYPVQTSALVLYFDSRKALTAYSSTSSSLALPTEYETALKFALAVDWAPELSAQVPQVVAARATDTKSALKRLRAHPVAGIRTAPFGVVGGFDINSGGPL